MSALDVGEVLGSAAPGLRRGDAPRPRRRRVGPLRGVRTSFEGRYLEHAVEARIAGPKNGILIVFALVLVFLQWDLVTAPSFAGFDNVRLLANDGRFWRAVGNTFVFLSITFHSRS
jgi:hypothetical protein